ncbi:hypothetical protein [Cesiribacter sp. SM1]|uniref:hypothetical protein n=1 Tax=Cesiribacter sp. SM1 TaxID=2861196 RepID=UPI001CD6FAD5|nr:hypothetical protein [Cesiribacter sp. SM1]
MKHYLIPYGLLIISLALLLLDRITDLEINSIIVYFFILFIALGTGRLIIGGSSFKIDIKKAVGFALIITTLAYIVRSFIVWGGNWKTQTVVYQNLHLPNRTVEFQMQDIGARGYNRRTVDRIKLFPFIDWIRDIDDANIDTGTWKKVDIDINEIGLKGG